MAKTVGILVEDLYQDQEVWYPYYRLQEAGAKVVVIGTRRAKEFKSKFGYPITADTSADQAQPDQLDGLIIPGGFAPDFMRRDPAMAPLVRAVAQAGKPVGAICHGGWMLCSADVITGKTVTSFFAIKDDMVHAGAKWVDQPVVRDGNLITSRKPEDLPAFMKTFLQALQ